MLSTCTLKFHIVYMHTTISCCPHEHYNFMLSTCTLQCRSCPDHTKIGHTCANAMLGRRQTLHYNVTMTAFGPHYCSGKVMSITQPDCVFEALVIQHVRCMNLIVLCHLTRSRIFSTLYHKRHDFRKKTFLNTKCVSRISLQILFETFLILRIISEILSKMYVGLHVKYPLFLSDINES
jgi:hypothetical protein